MSPQRPGGQLAARPLNFIWLCDASGSMTLDGKMDSLNRAIREALPHMRDVADENPNARLLMRTMSFAKNAEFLEPEPIPLEAFEWKDIEAEMPEEGEFSAEFCNRLEREGAKSGTVTISLMWNNRNDLDLHVIAPNGDEICFSNKKSRCGGELDVDMNVNPESDTPVENIYWPNGEAPIGRYRVLVHHFNQHDVPGCSDPTSYTVAVKYPGFVKEFTGSIAFGANPDCVHEFDLTADAVASDSGNTAMGAALGLLAKNVQVSVMPERGLSPVAVLVSDGQPTDDFEQGLCKLMNEPWGKKMVRIAIAIGSDADLGFLQKFIGHSELQPLQANNPEALTRYIRWVSTQVVKAASAPPSQVESSHENRTNVPLGPPPQEPISAMEVW